MKAFTYIYSLISVLFIFTGESLNDTATSSLAFHSVIFFCIVTDYKIVVVFPFNVWFFTDPTPTEPTFAAHRPIVVFHSISVYTAYFFGLLLSY